MPVLVDPDLESRKIPLGKYGYTAARIDDLGASEFTLVVLISDVSSSVADFQTTLESCIKEILQGCEKSPRADNLLVMHIQFARTVIETHGFRPLTNCVLTDYDNVLQVGGSTSLYDAWMFALSALGDYAKHLDNNEFKVNGLIACITDGDDNTSSFGADDVKKVIANINKQESLESLMSILIGVNIQNTQSEKDHFTSRLTEFKDAVGITQYEEISDTSAKTFAKLAKFVSQSVSSQSQSLGTGGASQPQTLTI